VGIAALADDDPAGPGAGATPLLRMFGIVEGGAELGRSALIARRLGAEGSSAFPVDFLADKAATAAFYADQLLPQVRGLLPAAVAGSAPLLAIPADRL